MGQLNNDDLTLERGTVESPVRHEEPIMWLSDWLYRETGISCFGKRPVVGFLSLQV